MLFTTCHWLLFLAVVFIAYHVVPATWRRWVMLASSCYFYASWSAPYLVLIAAHLILDWACGIGLGRTTDPRRRKAIVAASVVCNLGSLAVFKYGGLLTGSLPALGIQWPLPVMELPLGISFFAFESLSYTIDVYRGRMTPLCSPLDLALFVTWFPHLIAGPIIRPSELADQLQDRPAITQERFLSGANLMLFGYVKKVLLADWLAKVADPMFANPAHFTSLELLIGLYAYAWQIFLDFSAYTDIARGASRWFAVELPENFREPYGSASITDFWRRWHMTLSHWLRDYLYISLGGNRHGRIRTYANLMTTMLLGGLWHGASWTFVAWGGLHGLYLAVERACGVVAGKEGRGWQRVLRQVFTFHLVCLAWIFFRSPTFATAWAYLTGIAGGARYLTSAQVLPCVGALVLIGLANGLMPLVRRLPKPALSTLPSQLAYAVSVGALVIGLMIFGATSNVFIYFQF